MRGYDRVKLIKLCKIIGNIDRDKLLPYKHKKDLFELDKLNIKYLNKFDYNLNIKKIITEESKFTLNEYKLKNFKFNYIHGVNNNLNSYFVHNFKFRKNIKFKTKKCNERNCKNCKFIYEREYLKLTDSNVKLKLLCIANCNTENIVYVIICNKCNIYYVGESKKSLKIRTYQHLNHIKKFIPFLKYSDKIVALHFRRNNHKLSDFKVCEFKSNLDSSIERKSLEQDLINRLNTNKIRCINKITSKKCSYFILMKKKKIYF